MSFTLKDLIYSKQIKDENLHHKLLMISSSPTWVEDLIDLIVEMSEDDVCKVNMDCENCDMALYGDDCQYRKLMDKYKVLEDSVKECPGTWDCENCTVYYSAFPDKELCAYYKLKNKFAELAGSINEITVKLKTKNNHYEEKFTRYKAIKEEKGPIETLEDEVEHFIDKEVDKAVEDLKIGKKNTVGGIELPQI